MAKIKASLQEWIYHSEPNLESVICFYRERQKQPIRFQQMVRLNRSYYQNNRKNCTMVHSVITRTFNKTHTQLKLIMRYEKILFVAWIRVTEVHFCEVHTDYYWVNEILVLVVLTLSGWWKFNPTFWTWIEGQKIGSFFRKLSNPLTNLIWNSQQNFYATRRTNIVKQQSSL